MEGDVTAPVAEVGALHVSQRPHGFTGWPGGKFKNSKRT